jgi:hypothetical protein
MSNKDQIIPIFHGAHHSGRAEVEFAELLEEGEELSGVGLLEQDHHGQAIRGGGRETRGRQ